MRPCNYLVHGHPQGGIATACTRTHANSCRISADSKAGGSNVETICLWDMAMWRPQIRESALEQSDLTEPQANWFANSQSHKSDPRWQLGALLNLKVDPTRRESRHGQLANLRTENARLRLLAAGSLVRPARGPPPVAWHGAQTRPLAELESKMTPAWYGIRRCQDLPARGPGASE